MAEPSQPVPSHSLTFRANPPLAVIFDIGRVIIRVNFKRALAFLSSAAKDAKIPTSFTNATAEQIWAAIQNDPMWRDWQEGRVSPEQWYEQITRRLKLPLGFDEFCTAWNLALDPEPILADALFERLGASCRLALLSNTDKLHSEYIERHFSFVRHFPIRVYSWRIGSIKPSADIYGETLRQLGVPATAALYIDDVPEFAEAARRLGMDAICFEDPAQLGQELRLRNVAVD